MIFYLWGNDILIIGVRDLDLGVAIHCKAVHCRSEKQKEERCIYF